MGTSGATVAEIHAKLVVDESGLKHTAVNNRVNALRRLGLASWSSKRGKSPLWIGIRWPS